MTDTYFDYVLSKCKTQRIRRVCERYSTREQLQKSVTETWNDHSSIIKDGELLFALRDLFQNGKLFRVCNVTGDSLIVFNRCKKSLDDIRTKWCNRGGLDYDALFNMLVELCWLLASNAVSERSGYRNVILLSNHDQLNKSLRSFLDRLYDAALKEYNESVYIGEGISAKSEHPIIPALYDNRYEESMRYIRSDSTRSELQDTKDQYEYWCNYHLALYYGLTATAALADQIYRGLAQ